MRVVACRCIVSVALFEAAKAVIVYERSIPLLLRALFVCFLMIFPFSAERGDESVNIPCTSAATYYCHGIWIYMLYS